MTTETPTSRPATRVMEDKETRENNARTFVHRLEALAPTLEHDGDRAALAALRRGLGKAPGDDLKMLPYIVPILPAHLGPREEPPYYLTASLFALYPVAWPGGTKRQTFGASMRSLALDQGAARGGANSKEGDDEQSGGRLDKPVERRFVALLNADDEGESFATHLRHAVSLLKSSDTRIDWVQLLLDLGAWGRTSRPVQRRWAQDFWSPQWTDATPAPNSLSNDEEASDSLSNDDKAGDA